MSQLPQNFIRPPPLSGGCHLHPLGISTVAVTANPLSHPYCNEVRDNGTSIRLGDGHRGMSFWITYASDELRMP